MVDDDDLVRQMLADLLGAAGYTVRCAAHGGEILPHVREAGTPQLILLDLQMPVMSGWEFLRLQRSDAGLAPVPVVVLTADGPDAQSRARQQATAVLAKPIAAGALLTLVARLVPARARRSAASSYRR